MRPYMTLRRGPRRPGLITADSVDSGPKSSYAHDFDETVLLRVRRVSLRGTPLSHLTPCLAHRSPTAARFRPPEGPAGHPAETASAALRAAASDRRAARGARAGWGEGALHALYAAHLGTTCH